MKTVAPITVTDFLTQPTNYFGYRPAVELGDGTILSIQGHKLSYSVPRQPSTAYESVEVAIKGGHFDEIAAYAEDFDNPESVFGFVPVNVLDDAVAAHGGIVKIYGIYPRIGAEPSPEVKAMLEEMEAEMESGDTSLKAMAAALGIRL